ncbi:ATP12 ATPase [Parvibaculum lavamentivorans DS-1]|uniref:ATP12 ATPase n=1 Tax=Parvibaculum lavamentivorans (strain DS-1 / DSM 13023 / NCIMB 13966) TaxID=402881 RepID=A7HWU5_PARL1|nr:ATP12 family protein [Parvibaculum lavamentivorans]ABS64378.1 ATP12 ATPase [Parvibaculum lavamentivorans DS-1]
MTDNANDNDKAEDAAAAIFDLARNRSLDEQVAHPGREKRRVLKRFYKKAEAGPHEKGHAILLDGRAVKTPAKEPLAVPVLALARAIADEWEAQAEEIDPRAMKLTKLANTAIDLVAPRREAVIAELVNFAATDLLCYRADAPAALAARQAAAWEPLLAWAAGQGIRLRVTTGLMHVPQDEAALDAYGASVAALDPFRIAGLHNAVTLTGSAIIGLAVALGHIGPEAAFETAHIDETWQMEICGEDDEELARLAARRAELLETARFLALMDA